LDSFGFHSGWEVFGVQGSTFCLYGITCQAAGNLKHPIFAVFLSDSNSEDSEITFGDIKQEPPLAAGTDSETQRCYTLLALIPRPEVSESSIAPAGKPSPKKETHLPSLVFEVLWKFQGVGQWKDFLEAYI